MDTLNALFHWNYLLLMLGLSAFRLGVFPYVLYPLWIRLSHRIQRPTPTPTAFEVVDESTWPTVDMVFAAYNEEAVLEEKFKSIQALDYPVEKLRIWVGSDCSTDATEDILTRMATEMPQLQWEGMSERSGKSCIINHLVSKGHAEVIVGTDANILFHPMALKHMMAPLVLNPRVAMVGGELTYRGMNEGDAYTSIAREEKSYIGWENRTKVCEGELFGMTMGVEGGCYALRRAYFTPIPQGTFMEDFYLTMHVLKKNRAVVQAALATCSEDVSNDSQMEYRRKVRISHGNWQNTLFILRGLWGAHKIAPSKDGLSWSKVSLLTLVFVGHKLLRWLFPVLVLACLGFILGMGIYHNEWTMLAMNMVTFGGVGLLVLFPSHTLPRSMARIIKPFSYFIWMNIALVHGLIQYIRTPASSSGVWEPTKRNNQ